MVKKIELFLILLFALVATSSAMGLDMAATIHPEYRIQPEEYQQLKPLQSWGNEFSTQFQNISLKDLQIPSTRAPSLQDLQCLADMQRLMQGLSSSSLWALRMIDSWGSLPSGLLYLNLVDIGNYKECTRINEEFGAAHRLRGKHCFANIPMSQLPVISSIRIGICFPASCSAAHMDTVLAQLLQRLLNVDYAGQLVNEKSCKTNDSTPLEGMTLFTIILLSVFGGLAVLATLWDYFLCQDQKQLPRLIKIFSIRVSSRAIFRVTEIKSNPNVIDCLHGIRCLSLIWVVYGHEYMFGAIAPSLNRIDLVNWMGLPYSSFLLHAQYAVDTFFFLSGMLLFMIALRNMNKTKGRLNVPLMYLHRYLRLTPLVAIAILISMYILPLLLDAPLSGQGWDDFSKCERTWYLTLLYVQNYATKDICLSHSWYLSVDMQLYIISPLLLFALYKWGKKAAIAIAILIVLLTVWLFTTMMVNKYSVLSLNSQNPDSVTKIYFATHQHATPWLIGGLFGYILHVTRGKSFKLNMVTIWTGWLIALAIMFTSIFALYPYAKWSGPSLPMLDDALYYSLTRIAWPMALCWLVFACMHGYGGLANSFLSSPLWQPLSRLSYAVYVMHIFTAELNSRRIQTNTYFSDYDMMLKFWSDFGFTVLIAYVLHIIIEAPLGGLESLILSGCGPSPKPAARDPLPETKQNLPHAELEAQPTAPEKPKEILE